MRLIDILKEKWRSKFVDDEWETLQAVDGDDMDCAPFCEVCTKKYPTLSPEEALLSKIDNHLSTFDERRNLRIWELEEQVRAYEVHNQLLLAENSDLIRENEWLKGRLDKYLI